MNAYFIDISQGSVETHLCRDTFMVWWDM